MCVGLRVLVDGIVYQLQPHGGISRLFSEILPRMCHLDDSLRITLLTEGRLRQSLPQRKHITHRRIPSVRRYLRPRRVWKPVAEPLRRLVRRLWAGRGEGQIWHSTYYTRPEPWDGLQVVTVVDMIHERFPELFNRPSHARFRERKRRCVQEADAVICISETTRQDVQSFYGLDSDSISVIPLACSAAFRRLEQSDRRLEMVYDQPFLLYVGRRYHCKNFHALIRAYSAWSHREEVILAVVGGLWSDEERHRLADLHVQDRVHLLTDVSDEALCQLYNRAVAFVYPSLYEGFGIPLLEAMACGCPVVASRIASTVEVAGACPIYFEPTEVDSLVHALDVAMAEGRESQRVEMGFDRVRRYSWEKTAELTLAVYRSVQ